jgi:hypothetical protein
MKGWTSCSKLPDWDSFTAELLNFAYIDDEPHLCYHRSVKKKNRFRRIMTQIYLYNITERDFQGLCPEDKEPMFSRADKTGPRLP